MSETEQPAAAGRKIRPISITLVVLLALSLALWLASYRWGAGLVSVKSSTKGLMELSNYWVLMIANGNLTFAQGVDSHFPQMTGGAAQPGLARPGPVRPGPVRPATTRPATVTQPATQPASAPAAGPPLGRTVGKDGMSFYLTCAENFESARIANTMDPREYRHLGERWLPPSSDVRMPLWAFSGVIALLMVNSIVRRVRARRALAGGSSETD